MKDEKENRPSSSGEDDSSDLAKRLNLINYIVITVTFILFTISVFTKGFTHELFLELGIFLVSVKLIISVYDNRLGLDRIEKKLYRLEKQLFDSKD